MFIKSLGIKISLLHRYGDFKWTTFFFLTFNAYLAIVIPYNVFHNGKSKACPSLISASCLIYPVKPIENFWQMFFFYPTPLIINHNIYEMAFYSVCVLSQGEAVKICKLCNNALAYLLAD